MFITLMAKDEANLNRKSVIDLKESNQASLIFGAGVLIESLLYTGIIKSITMNKNITKLSVKEKIGYGLGDTASHFVWDMVGFWILIFYTDTFGISAAAAGTIMLDCPFLGYVERPPDGHHC
jgi:hypothetical protein